MSDDLPTIWPCSPHTKAKHRILERYLKAWMPILARFVKPPHRVLFIDGFAGPGEYENHEPGSPIIALRTAAQHAHCFPVPIDFLFIEKDPDRLDHLRGVLQSMKPELASNNINLLPPVKEDCATQIGRVIDQYKATGRKFGPALAFLDQFGYSAVPMALVGRILEHEACEVFSYLEWNNFHRYLTDPTKAEAFTRAFGGEEWRGAIGLSGSAKEKFVLDAYVAALKKRAGAKFVSQFAMRGENNALLYRLFFCTNHPRGLEEMKKAMSSVDESGSFTFSDHDDPGQIMLLSAATQEWLAEHLHRHFQNATVLVEAVAMYVLTDTPCARYKTALEALEQQERLTAVDPPPKRRRGAFPDGMKVRFHDAPPAKQKAHQGSLF